MPPYIINQRAISSDHHIPSCQFHSLFYIIYHKMIFALNNTLQTQYLPDNPTIIHNKKESRNYRKYHYKNKKKEIPFIY
jgi:hypothetical protein